MDRSPWLEQLSAQRPLLVLDHDRHDDVVIVGGGIAGIVTAYFLLTRTGRKVTVLEAGKLAHGATGHNAGQAVSYFERPFSELADQFGLELAGKAVEQVESAWGLLEEIGARARLRTPISRMTGFVGFADMGVFLSFLENQALMARAGLRSPQVFVAGDAVDGIPKRFDGLYAPLPRASVRSLLETDDPSFFALQMEAKGCMNSALFTEELAGYLLATYPTRFAIFEHSAIGILELGAKGFRAIAGTRIVSGNDVVLCTNGFEHFTILDRGGADIDARFHRNVSGVVGFMAAKLEPLNRPPAAISYLDGAYAKSGDYAYMTRRPHEREKNVHHNLVCLGGPVLDLGDSTDYPERLPLPQKAEAALQEAWSRLHGCADDVCTPFDYRWHGLMGYTKNRVRLVGRDPRRSSLHYNLGCNGIGILPSIFGGKRISQIFNEEKLEPCIFDPKHHGLA